MEYLTAAFAVISGFSAAQTWRRKRASASRQRQRVRRRVAQTAAWDAVLVRAAQRRGLIASALLMD
jgi:hypothetical protein